MSTEKVYSNNNEDYSYTELSECVESYYFNDSVKAGDVVTVFEADAVKAKASSFVYGLMDSMQEKAYDEYGEYAEHWPDTDQKNIDVLEEVVKLLADLWATNYDVQPTFYKVDNVKEIKVKILNDDYDYEVINQ